MRLQFWKMSWRILLDVISLFLNFVGKFKIIVSRFIILIKEPISKARMKLYSIRSLKKEYIPFANSIQGWPQEPLLVEFENLFSSQDSLAQQMADVSFSSREGDALFFKKKKNILKIIKMRKRRRRKDGDRESSSSKTSYHTSVKCYQWHKIGT